MSIPWQRVLPQGSIKIEQRSKVEIVLLFLMCHYSFFPFFPFLPQKKTLRAEIWSRER